MERREKEREEGEIRSKKMEGGKKEETEVERHALAGLCCSSFGVMFRNNFKHFLISRK